MTFCLFRILYLLLYRQYIIYIYLLTSFIYQTPLVHDLPLV
jgi:hypothetical protein